MITVDNYDRKETTKDPNPAQVIFAIDRFFKGELKSVKLYRRSGRKKVVKPATAVKR